MAADEVLFERLKADIFLDGPGDFLAKAVATEIAKVKQWKEIFRDAVETYERFDFSIRELPALRVYNLTFRKETESHYCVGDLLIDIVLPPSMRRKELQTVQDTLSSAMLQQFRRPQFFSALRDVVPGLNEMGKVFNIDKTLGMQYQEQILPITQIQANFRIDLKEWDHYLERESRTKDEPFTRTLGALEQIVSTIDGIRVQDDLSTKEVSIETEQDIGG